MRVGFIGVGRIGGPMCRGLAERGFELIAFDVDAAALTELQRTHGVAVGASPADVAAGSEVVLTSLPGPAEDEAIMSGSDGLLAGAHAQLVVADATTIGVAQARRFAERARARGAGYLDAPVSIIRHEGVPPTRTFMVGGEAADVARARPVLEAIAAQVRHVGPSGAGAAAKLVNQVVYVGYLHLFGEALALATELGLSLEPLLAVLETSSAGIPNVAEKYDAIRGLAQSPSFPIDNALKYLDLVAEAASNMEAAPVTQALTAALRAASQAGRGKEDLVVAQCRN